MILLDENIRQDQGTRLRQWRVRCRFLIGDFAPSGIQDPDIIPLLQRLNEPTSFTHDQDFTVGLLFIRLIHLRGWMFLTVRLRHSSAPF